MWGGGIVLFHFFDGQHRIDVLAEGLADLVSGLSQVGKQRQRVVTGLRIVTDFFVQFGNQFEVVLIAELLQVLLSDPDDFTVVFTDFLHEDYRFLGLCS